MLSDATAVVVFLPPRSLILICCHDMSIEPKRAKDYIYIVTICPVFAEAAKNKKKESRNVKSWSRSAESCLHLYRQNARAMSKKFTDVFVQGCPLRQRHLPRCEDPHPAPRKEGSGKARPVSYIPPREKIHVVDRSPESTLKEGVLYHLQTGLGHYRY